MEQPRATPTRQSLPLRPIVSAEAESLYTRIVSAAHQPEECDQPAVRQLLNLGLLREVSYGYVAVDPSYVSARWQASFHEQAAAMLTNAAQVGEELSGLSRAYESRTVDAGLIEYLRGSDTINARLAQVLAGSTEELLFCQPGGVRRPEVLDETSQRDLAAVSRGVKMRTLYHEMARAGENMNPWVEVMTSAGAEIRTLNEPFQRMFIIDRRIAVVPGNTILTTSSEAVAYLVNDPGVAGFLAAQFERDWDRAEQWTGSVRAGALTSRQELILRCLAVGDAHMTIARKLGIGQRKQAEAIAELKIHFGVETLFELACAWKDSLVG